jgi:hypothetical protein
MWPGKSRPIAPRTDLAWRTVVADLPEYLKDWTPSSSIPAALKGYLDEYRDTRDICIRAKWTFDGANTLAEAAQRLRDYAIDLEGLAALGFELRDEITDDYGFIGRPDDDGPLDPDDWPESIVVHDDGDADDLEPAS